MESKKDTITKKHLWVLFLAIALNTAAIIKAGYNFQEIDNELSIVIEAVEKLQKEMKELS